MPFGSDIGRFGRSLWRCKQYVISWSAPILLLPIILFNSGTPEDNRVAGCAYALSLMAIYWLTEAVPLAITALLPVVLFPLLGILDSGSTVQAYMKEAVMIFLGSLIAAAAVEVSGLHQRIALKVLMLFGTSPKWLLLGFMLNTMFLSMWISNTAATALMIPIVDAVLVQLRHRTKSVLGNMDKRMSIISSLDGPESGRPSSFPMRSRASSIVPLEDPSVDEAAFVKMKTAIYLGICYAANIGGTGTLTGTTTNLILVGLLQARSIPMDFATWFTFAVPGMLICVFLAWLFIVIVFLRGTTDETANNNEQNGSRSDAVSELIKKKYELLGDTSFHEHAVLWLFVGLILLWFFRAPEFMTGWTKPIVKNFVVKEENDRHKFIEDSMPAIFVVILYFMIPCNPMSLSKSPPLMTWKVTQEKVSWNVILLLGGGLALSDGAKASGLSKLLGDSLTKMLSGMSSFTVQLVTSLIALFMTEVASNSTTATILCSVVGDVALSMGIAPLKLMLPVALSCSYAFMLPVSSPPNAIIFEAAEMKTKDMAIPGLAMKFICLAVTLVCVNTLGGMVFDLNSAAAPNSTMSTMSALNATTVSSLTN
ncbi:Solute carrier family 13 member 5 [Halotydeus destructor]|nr:Solute carrier family 13 member 5 [Halotydeus destructor]